MVDNGACLTALSQDRLWMCRALLRAQHAGAHGEVPVGAVLVDEAAQCPIAWGENAVIGLQDPTAHAEMMVLRQAGMQRHNYRLLGTTLYVTLEPCAMCVGALVHARVKRVVFGAYDDKTGALKGAFPLLEWGHFNHIFLWEGGVEADACAQLLREFFASKR